MTSRDAFGDFEAAVAALEALKPSVARQTDASDVFDAVQALQLAVSRSYGGRRPRAASGRGARGRILEHLQQHVGDWVPGEELAAVSGIGEWARRVRELRLEQGYQIEEQTGAYRLVDLEPDREAALRWQALHAIRGEGGSPQQRVLAVLSTSVGAIVSGTELAYVVPSREVDRVVRDLRDGECVPIDSAMDSRGLGANEFRLVSVGPGLRRDDRQALFSESVRAFVFRRDDYTCARCGLDRDSALDGGAVVFWVEVHHLRVAEDVFESLSVDDLGDPTSLVTLCHECLGVERVAARRRRRLGPGSSDRPV